MLRLIENSERQSEAEAELPLVVLRTGDGQETTTTQASVWVIEVWRIEEIGRIGPELQIKAFCKLERSEQTEVEVHGTWPK